MAYKNYIKVYNIDGCSINEQYLLSFLINQPKDNSLFWKKVYLEHLFDVGRKELNAMIQHLSDIGLLETKSYRNKGTQFKLLGEAKETRDMLLNDNQSTSTDRREEYRELLLDKRWKEKRQHILDTKGHVCSMCGATEQLQVHHLRYLPNHKPWEYDDKDLVVLCQKCHYKVHHPNHIDNDFFNDLNSLKRSELVDKYFPIYPFCREPEYKIDNSKSYIDLRNQDYYEVFNKTRFDGDKGKFVKKKVENGNRHHQLFLDAIQFKAANPSISIEGLILALVNEVLNYYDNSDKEMTNKAIIQTALKVFNGDYKASKSKKKIKVNKSYFHENECSIQKKIGIAKRDLKDDAIGELIDLNLSLEDNLDVIRKNGISLKKKRLVEFCERYNIKLKTNKEIRNDKIIDLYNSNKDLSIAKLETICEMNGIDVSHNTIEKIIKEYLNESNQTKIYAQLKYCVYDTKLASVV